MIRIKVISIFEAIATMCFDRIVTYRGKQANVSASIDGISRQTGRRPVIHDEQRSDDCLTSPPHATPPPHSVYARRRARSTTGLPQGWWAGTGGAAAHLAPRQLPRSIRRLLGQARRE